MDIEQILLQAVIVFLALLMVGALLMGQISTKTANYYSYQKLLTGTFASRPSAAILDRWYYATDTTQMFYDNGTAWITVPLGNSTTDTLAHRPWNLFDEPSWSRTLYLPLGTWTKVGVALITVTGWHNSWVSHPRVLYNEAEEKYWVYFAGGNTWRSIGLATGTSLKSALTEITDGISGTSRVLDKDAGNAWESTGVSYPAVIYDPLDSDSNKRWKMLYNGRNAGGAYADIGYAYSADGKSWTKSASNPVIDLADVCEAPTLVRGGNKFYCLYRRDGDIYASYSDDCVTWTEFQSILDVGAPGTWDDAAIAYPTLYFDQGTWYMCYAGHDGTRYRIGLATSNKFFETWFKLPYNPTLSESPQSCASGCLIRMEDEFLMVYESNDPNRAIRSATIS